MSKSRIGGAVILMLLMAGALDALKLYVPSGQYPTIRRAIELAQDGDVISVWKNDSEPCHVYQENLLCTLDVRIVNRSYDTNLVGFPPSPDYVVIQSPPARTGAVTFKGRSSRRIHPTIEGFTIRGGKNAVGGGGIRCESTSATIANNRIVACTSDVDGGGICFSGLPDDTAFIFSNAVDSNYAGRRGGGVYVTSVTAGRSQKAYVRLILNSHFRRCYMNQGVFECRVC